MSKKKKEIYYAEPRPFTAHVPEKEDCIVTDLDGTIALINGRSWYNPEKFDTDLPNKPIIDIIRHMLCATGADLIVLSGRMNNNVGLEKTENWMREVAKLYPDAIFMRKHGDFRDDYTVKSELIRELQKTHNIICAFDDRDSSCQAYRDHGVPCMQVWKEEGKK